MAGYWPQQLPALTTGETEVSRLQELPCGQGRDRFDSFINLLVLLSRCHISKVTHNINIEFKCSILSGILDTVMSLSSQIIEDLITSSDSTTMSLNIIPGISMSIYTICLYKMMHYKEF